MRQESWSNLFRKSRNRRRSDAGAVAVLRRIADAMVRRARYARYFLLARRDSRRNLTANQGRNILVLCYGNIYRSPFVAAKLESLLSASGWSFRSAGFHDREGRPSVESFVSLAVQNGVALSEHRSRRVLVGDIEWADLVVIMDGKNRLMLKELSPDADGKVIWLGAWAGDSRPDVSDPYGLPLSEVRKIVERMSRSVERLVQEIR